MVREGADVLEALLMACCEAQVVRVRQAPGGAPDVEQIVVMRRQLVAQVLGELRGTRSLYRTGG